MESTLDFSLMQQKNDNNSNENINSCDNIDSNDNIEMIDNNESGMDIEVEPISIRSINYLQTVASTINCTCINVNNNNNINISNLAVININITEYW